MENWINIKEVLPPKDCPVFIYGKKDEQKFWGMGILSFAKDNDFSEKISRLWWEYVTFPFGTNICDFECVTHWMALPQKPIE